MNKKFFKQKISYTLEILKKNLYIFENTYPDYNEPKKALEIIENFLKNEKNNIITDILHAAGNTAAIAIDIHNIITYNDMYDNKRSITYNDYNSYAIAYATAFLIYAIYAFIKKDYNIIDKLIKEVENVINTIKK